MREIKFRAWNKHLGKMEEEVCINECGEVIHFDYGEYAGVTDDIVMQYTGLVDKNSTKIYEGDVLHLEGYAVMYVEFVDGEFVAKSTNSIQRVNWQPLRLIALVNKGYKVIGNLYEHNHLLGDNK